MTRTCTVCKETKPLDEGFHVDRQNPQGRSLRCKVCAIARSARWYAENIDYARARGIAYGKANQDKIRDANLRTKYGIGLIEYDAMLAAQGGGCAICGRDTDQIKDGRSMPVDHDHKTNQVRGVLCSNHNRAIGLFDDNVEHMTRAIEYIQAALYRTEAVEKFETTASS